jgi:hypothetical protein
MAKIIATTFGGAVGLFGLIACASPTAFGAHGSPVGILLHLLLGAVLVAAAWKGGPSLLLGACTGAAMLFLAWGLAGLVFGRPGASSLGAMPPDLHLLVIIPGVLEGGRSDHLLHLFFGVAFGVSGVVCLAETPLRLRKR